ncbi:MAG: serine/threonine-protein kinase [Planctomycetota bacterium]
MPEKIGRYRLLSKLGEGGFGTVHRAQQTEGVQREVALKLLRPGMDSPEIVTRFEAERQALALMDHPGIAKVLDAGVAGDGRPWFAMELVDGSSITEYCDGKQLPLQARLRLFEEVCQVVQHAHQKGVIHRDLKPSNILVTEIDGKARPVVIDFGVAKALGARLTEVTFATQSFQVLGTPEYMSPEQASGRTAEVDTRADVYALGVLLYELTTGTKPFALQTLLERGYEEVLRVIRDVDPPRPSLRVGEPGEASDASAHARSSSTAALARDLRGDLDWIVMRAIEKERERRYDGVGELAADVRRHLEHEPVSASPPSVGYRLRKLVRRHRGGVAAAVALFVLFVAGSAGTAIGLVRASDEAERAGLEAQRYARVSELLEGMLDGVRPAVALGRDTELLRDIVDRTRERVDEQSVEATSRVDREVEWTLRRFLANAYEGIGAFRIALEDADRTCDLAAELYGPASIEAASAVVLRGDVLYELDEFVRGTEELPPAIESLKSDPDGRSDVVLAKAWVTLGNHQRELSRFDEAKRSFREALAICAGNDSMGVMESSAAANLAKVHADLEEREDALRWHERSLEIKRSVYEGDHPGIASSMTSIGRSHLALGEVAAAEQWLLDGAEMARRLYEPTHPSFSAVLFNLARFYKLQKRYGEAEAVYLEVLDIDRANAPEGNRHLVSTLTNIGALYRAMGRLDETERYYEESFEMHERLGLDADVDHGVRLTSLALLQEQRGRLDDAADSMAAGHEILQRDLGDEHSYTAQAALYLSRIRMNQGDLEGAADAAALAVPGMEAVFGGDDPRTIDTVVYAAEIDLRRGLADSSEAGFRDALARCIEHLPADHPTLANCRLDLGRALQALERFEDAEEQFMEAWRLIDEDSTASIESRSRYASDISKFYAAWGESEEAAAWREIAGR